MSINEPLDHDFEDDLIVVGEEYLQQSAPVPIHAYSTAAKLGAEAFGTFWLVLAGLGVGLYAGDTGLGTLGTVLAFGFALITGIVAVGHISGGHFNPAVTFGAAVAGRTPWRDVPGYIAAQLAGAITAAALLFVVAASHPQLQANSRAFFNSVVNGFGEHAPLGFGMTSALVVEAVATAVFVGIILGATDRLAATHLAPVAIGITLAMTLAIAVPVTGGGLNPARSTAAALFGEPWGLGQLWLFWVAPILGAVVAGLIYRAFALPIDDYTEYDDELAASGN